MVDVHVAKAHAALEAATGVSARAFAHQFGTHDLAARRAVAEAGFDVAARLARPPSVRTAVGTGRAR